ncbi:MAG: phosphomannomutase/phosphoglucomutase [Patescibacteria group bacterium]|jgi:phosphomannomutase|nr:phosphomannomutase/phosphoglucomutase [Patescibacteria group bacterium]
MLKINPKIFKSYDIRGIYGQDFDNDLASKLGMAFVSLRRQDGDCDKNKPLTIAVSSDMRISSPALKTCLIRGLTEAGANVVDLGLQATPTLYFAVGKYEYDGGIMISASHNPKDWNGFKLVRKMGIPVSGETGISYLKDKIIENHFFPVPKDEIGKSQENPSVLSDSIRYALSVAPSDNIGDLKIVIDTANGMSIVYLKELIKKISINPITLNFTLNGNFPAHEADPLKTENLDQLKKAIFDNRADLGIATDGDGDRIFFVDNNGEVVDPAILRGLLAKLFLKDNPGAKIGYDVRPGKITVDIIKENGGIPVMTKVGHSLIKEQMIKEDIYFAGESSGHFYFNGKYGCFEYPEITILKFITAISKSGKKVSEFLKPYKKYYNSGEINKEVKNKEEVFSRIKEKYSDGEITELDGVSVEYENYWFNVRASNTEAKMRLNLEGISPEIVEEKKNEIISLIY